MKRIDDLSKLLLVFLLVIFVFSAATLTFINIHRRLPFSQIAQVAKVSPQLQEDKQVLGNYYQAPQIYVSGTENSYNAGGLIAQASTDEPAVQIGSYNALGSAEIEVFQANQEALFNYLIHDKDNKQTNKKVDTTGFNKLTTVRLDLAANTNGSGSRLTLPISGKGVWYLRLKFGAVQVDSFVLRSDNGVLVREGDNQFIFWGQDFKSKRSINSGTLKLFNLTNGKNELASINFGQDGVAKAPVSREADVAIAQIADDIVLVPINLAYLNSGPVFHSFVPKQRTSKVFTFTDRPLYRPGDTIYFKSILRDEDDARYSIPSGTAIVKIYDGYEYDRKDPIFQKTIPISGSGGVDSFFKLPDDAKTGNYTLSVSLPGSHNSYSYYSDNSDYTSSIYFNVEFFRKPDHFISLQGVKDEFITGDPASVKIKGSYFSGQPLKNQPVSYKIYASNYYDYEYYGYLTSFQSYLSDQYRYAYYSSGADIGGGGANFNDKGETVIQIPTKLQSALGKNQVYSIEAQFDDGSGNPSFARKNIVVYAAEFGIYRKDFNYSSRVGQSLELPLVLVAHQGGNISGVNLSAKVERSSWFSYNSPDSKYPLYREEKESLPPILAKADSSGNAKFNFTPTKQGAYTFTVEGVDSRGNKTIKQFYFYVTDQNYAYYGQSNNDLTINSDKAEYQPTDSAKLRIYSVVPNRDVFLSLERDRVDRYQIVHLNGQSTEVELPLASNDQPNIYAQVSSFSSNGVDSTGADLKVSTDNKKLKVTVTPNKAKFGPGESVGVNIQTTDLAGNPVPAEVTIWSVDKALFELMDSNLGQIFDTFWSHRFDGTSNAHSLEGISVRTAERGGCFAAGTKVLMADGSLRNIEELKIGDYVLSRKSETDQTLVKAKVTATEKQQVSGYLIINGDLKVTPYHRLFINGNFAPAGEVKIGDLLTGKDGQLIPISSLEWQKGKFEVYNLEIETYKTYFANGVWVHNQKGGGGTRSIFKDTAYWNPSVQTDLSGRAQVSFKLPDNLTTWVIAAVGSTPNTQVGQTESEIIVSKDLIVRPVLPNILRTSDKVILTSLVQNFTDLERKFDVDFTLDGAQIKQATYSAIPIKAQDMTELSWEVMPKVPAERVKLTFSAREVSATSSSNKKLVDTVVEQLPVRDFGFRQNSAQTGDGPKSFALKLNPDSNLEKSTVTLSLAPTLIGVLPASMKYLLDYPYGCIEQTTSRFVPVVIAKLNPTLFGDIITGKDLDAMLQRGFSRLNSLQNSDGGWSWWYNRPSDPFITSYVVEYLLLLQNNGIVIDKESLGKAKAYLGSENTKEDLDAQVSRAYGRALIGEKKKIVINNFDKLGSDSLALAAMANFLNGDQNPQTNGLASLQIQAVSQGNFVSWRPGLNSRFGSEDASTALAIRAILLAGGDRELASKGMRYLTRNRQYDYWSNTYGTAQAMRAIVEFSKSENETNPSYTYSVKLDDKVISSGSVTSSKQKLPEIKIPLKNVKAGGSSLVVDRTGEGQIYSTLVIKEFRTDKNAQAVSHGISVGREYINQKGEEYSLAVGDIVTVKLTVKGLKSENNYGIIEDELPAGLVPINERFKNEQYGQQDYYYNNALPEITENGAILSTYYMPTGGGSYSYRARVVSQGEFWAPPAKASLMYNPAVYAQTAPELIKVDKTSHLIPGKGLKNILAKPGNLLDLLKENLLIILITIVVLGSIISLVFFREKIVNLLDKIRNRNNPPPPPFVPPSPPVTPPSI